MANTEKLFNRIYELYTKVHAVDHEFTVELTGGHQCKINYHNSEFISLYWEDEPGFEFDYTLGYLHAWEVDNIIKVLHIVSEFLLSFEEDDD